MSKQQAIDIAREVGLHINVMNLIEIGISPFKALVLLGII